MYFRPMNDDMPSASAKGMTVALPKLRRNKRLEQKWGQKYYAAVKEAVFKWRPNPYMPSETPLSIRDETDDCQPMYMCKQCKDCFRFRSSLQAHKARRSWILGYWCHNCFFVNCSHVPKGRPPCPDCQAINRQRTISLKAKGLKKGRKMCCIKIFYNQCQFFAHLKRHNIYIVDMADLMLMPIPTDVDKESYAELEQITETIMERMFLKRMHIMDWLQSHRLGNRWWHLLRTEDGVDPLADLFAISTRSRRGRNSVKSFGKLQKASAASYFGAQTSSSNTPSTVSETIESVVAQSSQIETAPPAEVKLPEMPPLSSITFIDPSEPVEDDDNPWITADIAFVDCGPAARTFPPEVAEAAEVPEVDIVLSAKDKLRMIPKGNTTCNSILKVNSHPTLKVSGSPSVPKQHQVHKVIPTSSPISASSESSHLFESKITVKKFAQERLETPSVISSQRNQLNANLRRSQTMRKLAPLSDARLTGAKKSRPTVMEIVRTVDTAMLTGAKDALSSLGTQILTVHSPKSAELSKIISHLPPDVMNGKKIVFIGQDAERFTIHPKSDATTSNSGMIKIQSETEKAKVIQNVPNHMAPMIVSNIGNEQSVRVASETSNKDSSMDKSKPKNQPIYLDGQVIYQNGKKFIIRHARKPIPESTICTNLSSLKLKTIPKRVNLSSFLSKSRLPITSYIPITPKSIDTGENKVEIPITSSPTSPSPFPSLPPPLSLSTSEDQHILMNQNGDDSGCVEKSAESQNSVEPKSLTVTSLCSPLLRDVHVSDAVEYFSIKINAAGNSYVDFSSAKEVSPVQPAVDYKQQMLDNFRRLGAKRVKQQIDHLMEINAEYSRMVDIPDDVRISDNLKAIKNLADALKEKPPHSDQDLDIDHWSSDDDINEILFNLKETRTLPFTCLTCNRSISSESLVLEFPKGSDKSPVCSKCNNYVCHICHVFQGNMSRFRAHLNFHAKQEPFTCPECFRKFSTFDRLEAHTWSTCFHPLARRWFKCEVCQVEGFLGMDSVTKHFILVHSRLKIACPECGIVLKSGADFEKHREKDHLNVTVSLKPLNLIVCDVGNCVVRLENYRSHMDHHTAVTSMVYYKCCFCPFLIKVMKKGREQMKSHLLIKHRDKLSRLMSFQNKHPYYPKQSLASDQNSQNDYSQEILDVSISNSCSEKKDLQSIEVRESEQVSDVSDPAQKNVEKITLDSIEHDPKADNQSPSNYLNAILYQEMSQDGVGGNIGSVNLDYAESPDPKDFGSECLEILTNVREAANTDHVITEYSSSPKIFDVRSVTPDSYAELDEVTKEDDSGGFVGIKILDRSEQIVVSEAGMKDALLVKMGDQVLPRKLPHVIVVNQDKRSLNLTEILQSTFTASNKFIKMSDPTNSDGKPMPGSAVYSGMETTLKKPNVSMITGRSVPVVKSVCTTARPPRPKESKKVTSYSATPPKHSGSVEVSLKQSVGGKQQLLPVSILRSKNISIQEIRTDITESKKRVPDSQARIADVSNIITNTSGTGEEKTKDLLFNDVPRPPPLARIPQRLLDVSQMKDEVAVEERPELKTTSPKSTVNAKQKQRRPWRIALNGPIHTSEVIIYRCHLCGDLINTSWSVLRNHFDSRHSQDYKLSKVTPRLLRMSDNFISEGYKETLGPRKRKSDGSTPNSKRRKRWNPKKHVDRHSLDSGLCVQQESVQDGEGNFVCKRCDQRCNDISSLRIHIGTNHRIKAHYLVCLECGENFVVEPSLQMHLKAFHRIQDPSTYMAQNTAYVKEITETVAEESNTGIANQCHVCMAVFEDKLAVDKHLRVHGMAFLNRKRIEAQNAARNPEKNSKIHKPDDSVAAAGQKNEKLDNHKLEKIESVNGTVRES